MQKIPTLPLCSLNLNAYKEEGLVYFLIGSALAPVPVARHKEIKQECLIFFLPCCGQQLHNSVKRKTLPTLNRDPYFLVCTHIFPHSLKNEPCLEQGIFNYRGPAGMTLSSLVTHPNRAESFNQSKLPCKKDALQWGAL